MLGIVAGFVHVGALLVVGSIAYVAWTARRTAGLLVALGAGALELHQRATPDHALVFACAWLALYVTVALVASAVERATRPDRSGARA